MGKKDISKEDPGKEEFQQIPSLTRQIIATCPGWSNSFFLGLGWGYISAGYDSLRVESELGLLSFPVTDYDVSQLVDPL
ncbi:unnamed protein product [Notodromas monacha]|uniref:Uncharacterized protein n=1 Tax=Notodromas monacha TaxID=399045 RepID=A0A7R9C1L3_9CRUS|nr:unnamed protein product [Notodromas monacha]CAG0924430.1 unnamed protein product [Notodromas monacha]